MTRSLAILVAIGIGAAACAQEVVLRASARVEPDRSAFVRDVADVAGPGAERLAGLVVVSDPGALLAAWVRVDADRVRAVIAEHEPLLAEVVTVRGAACYVRAVEPVIAPAPVDRAGVEEPAPDARRYVGEATVRGHVSARIAWILGVDPADLRLSFDGSDAELLATPTAGRVVEVQPTGRSDRLPLAVRVYEPSGVVASGTVRVGVLVRRSVLVAARPLRRGEIVTAEDVTRDEQWLRPGVRAASPEDAEGAVVRGRLDPGDLVTVDALDAPIVANKGDLVTVSSVSPSVVVSEIARATEAGRVGDVVRFESVDGRRRVFTARMSARGRAVAWAGPVVAQHQQEVRP